MTESLRFPAFPTASGAFPEDPGTVSREAPESADRFPPTVSPFPGVSDRFPPRFPASGTEPVLPRPALSIKRDAGNGPSDHHDLTTWLDSLKARQLTIDMAPDGPRINGRNLHLVTPHDTHQLTRHHHALQLAATGQHHAWWTHAIGHGPTPNIDDLPTVDDPDDRYGGWGFPCACCGQPADRLDSALLPWCTEHAA